MEVVVEALRYLLIIIFSSTGLSKIVNFKDFMEKVYTFSNIKNSYYRSVIAVSLLVLEFLTAGLLFTVHYIRIGSVLSIVLLVIYSIVVFKDYKTSRYSDCGCGGVLGNHQISIFLLIRNTLLIGFGTALFISGYTATQNFKQLILSFLITIVTLLMMSIFTRIGEMYRT